MAHMGHIFFVESICTFFKKATKFANQKKKENSQVQSFSNNKTKIKQLAIIRKARATLIRFKERYSEIDLI